jgi:hypothetical protein
MHNFGVMAQGLLDGESRFLSPCDFKELGVANGHFRQLLRDQPCDSLGASQREPIFGGRNKPQMLSNRNCFKLLVKVITASPIARCPSFKFLTMQMQPSASWARDCGPFYP